MQIIFKKLNTVFLAAILFLSALCIGSYISFLHTPLSTTASRKIFTVSKGASLYKIATDLKTQQFIQHKGFFILLARLNKLGTRLQAGEYNITCNMTPQILLEHMAKGVVVQYALTIIEGWTFKDMMDAVSKSPHLTHTVDGLSSAEIMARLGYPGEHPEGRFFPNTYYFPAGTLDTIFLKRAYQTLSKQLEQVWSERSPNLPYQTPYEALILASIIQKESGLYSEYPEIAGVYTRRLKKNMRLQADPTLIYGLGESCNKKLTYKQLRQLTPYNTYMKTGLPVTPIALVGTEALKAAVNPSLGNSLYFVSTGLGNHIFSNTLLAHNKAVRQYQKKR